MHEVTARPRRVLPALVATALLIGAAAVSADGLDTDRPSFTESTQTVSPGIFQLEGGFTYRSARVLGVYDLPELSIRYGALPRVEVRFGVPDYVRIDDSGNTDHRLGAASLGLKLQGGPPGSLTGVALIPAITLPVDPDDERHPAGELTLAWSFGLPEGEAVSGHVGYAWHDAAERGPDLLRASLTLARPVNERVNTFVEWSGELPRGFGAGTQYFHHGYSWSLSPNVRMDVHGAFGLTRPAPDFFLGAGVSVQP